MLEYANLAYACDISGKKINVYTKFAENCMYIYALLADHESKMLHCPFWGLNLAMCYN